MLVKELYQLVRSGKQPVVKFTEKVVEYMDESLDPFMMGKIIGASQEYEDSYRFRLDMNGFEVHNKSVAKQDWRDKNGVPCLTWFETSLYPEDGIEAVYLPVNVEAPLEIVEDDTLFGEYISEKSEKTYVEWLEDIVNRYRKPKELLKNQGVGMKDKFITLYKTPNTVVEGELKDEMTFEEAEALGKKYCQENGVEYVGTYTKSEVGKAKEEALQGIR